MFVITFAWASKKYINVQIQGEGGGGEAERISKNFFSFTKGFYRSRLPEMRILLEEIREWIS